MKVIAIITVIAFNCALLVMYGVKFSHDEPGSAVPENGAKLAIVEIAPSVRALPVVNAVLVPAANNSEVEPTAEGVHTPSHAAWQEPADGKEVKDAIPPIAEFRQALGAGQNRLLANTEFAPPKRAQKKLGLQADPNPRNLDPHVISPEIP